MDSHVVFVEVDQLADEKDALTTFAFGRLRDVSSVLAVFDLLFKLFIIVREQVRLWNEVKLVCKQLLVFISSADGTVSSCKFGLNGGIG